MRLSPCLLMVVAGCGAYSSSGGTAGAAGAVSNVAVAATLWAVTGCKLQGCPYGSYCDKATGWCETRKCGDGCPANTSCNEGLDRCQDPTPAQPPTDYLPEDNELRLPGS